MKIFKKLFGLKGNFALNVKIYKKFDNVFWQYYCAVLARAIHLDQREMRREVMKNVKEESGVAYSRIAHRDS